MPGVPVVGALPEVPLLARCNRAWGGLAWNHALACLQCEPQHTYISPEPRGGKRLFAVLAAPLPPALMIQSAVARPCLGRYSQVANLWANAAA
jgi:hypothetical protein